VRPTGSNKSFSVTRIQADVNRMLDKRGGGEGEGAEEGEREGERERERERERETYPRLYVVSMYASLREV